jgi:hypothetical protein
MTQDGFQRLAQRVETRIRRERQPGVCDAPPQDCDPVERRSIRGQICDDHAWLLPGRDTVFTCVTRMDRRRVDDHNGLVRDRSTQGITTRTHHAGVEGFFTQKWRQIVVAIPQPEPIAPASLPGRKRDDAFWLLPGRGPRGIQRTARCILIIQSALSLVFLALQRFQCTCRLGTGVRVSETWERLAHPLPSKPGFVGQTLQRRHPEALGRCGGEALRDSLESTRVFFPRVEGAVLCLRGASGRSAAARLIRQPLGAMVFPGRHPGRHGDAMDLRGLGDVLAGRALGTQEQAMGTAPHSAGGIMFHRVFSEVTLLCGQRLHISHDHSLIRSDGRSYDKRFVSMR